MIKNLKKAIITSSLIAATLFSSLALNACAKSQTINDVIHAQVDQQAIEQLLEKKEEQELEKIRYYLIAKYDFRGSVDKINKEDLKSLYNDIISTKFEWRDELNNYLNLIFWDDKNKTNEYKYDDNDKKLIQYLGDKDNLFRQLLLYYQPLKNIDSINDIDKDGIPYEQDEYPLNYTDGEVYVILSEGAKAESTPEINNGVIDLLINKLNYNPNNIYGLFHSSIKQYESTIEEVLSKTTERDIVFLLNDHHVDYYGNLAFFNEKGYEELYNISRLNKLFKGKDYAVVVDVENGCFGYTTQDLLKINKLLSVAVAKGDDSPLGFAAIVLTEQIDNKNIYFDDFLVALDARTARESRTKIIGKPNLPKNQEDWIILPANYKNK